MARKRRLVGVGHHYGTLRAHHCRAPFLGAALAATLALAGVWSARLHGWAHQLCFAAGPAIGAAIASSWRSSSRWQGPREQWLRPRRVARQAVTAQQQELLQRQLQAEAWTPLLLSDEVYEGPDEDDETSTVERDSFEVEDTPGLRLDVFLSRYYNQSRNYFDNMITAGAVLVNGDVKKKSFRKLQRGDLIDVRFLADEKTMPLMAEPIPLNVIYEDEDLLVINKPAGLVVHPSVGHWTGTLMNAVLHHVQSQGAPSPEAAVQPALVHRLDMGTSGVITVAKTPLAYKEMCRAFKDREVRKTYYAVVTNSRKVFRNHYPGTGVMLNHAIGMDPYNRLKKAVVPEECGGRPSSTLVRSVAESDDLALYEVKPETGRTHQIRVHLLKEHVPILGDPLYGSAWHNRRYPRAAARPLLHAYRLEYLHPRTRKKMIFKAPLPADVRQFVSMMAPEPRGEAICAELLGSQQAAPQPADGPASDRPEQS